MRVAFLGEPTGYLGAVHSALAKLLQDDGHVVTMLDWDSPTDLGHLTSHFCMYDRVVGTTLLTCCSSVDMNDPHVRARIVAVAHIGVISRLFYEQLTNVSETTPVHALCGVSPDTLVHFAEERGVTQPMVLTPIGIHTGVMRTHYAQQIQTLGFVGELNHPFAEHYDAVKRPDMAREIASLTGCKLVEVTPETIDAVDLIVCTSLVEGAAVDILEAAARGVPVISTRVGNLAPLTKLCVFNSPAEAVSFIRTFDTAGVEAYARELAAEVQSVYDWKHVYPKYWRPLFVTPVERPVCVQTAVFKNDGGVEIKFDLNLSPGHIYTSHFVRRDNHEVMFRRLSNYLIDHGYVNGHVIDSGAWIGDNTLPWAMKLRSTPHKVYAIDPSPDNCHWIREVAALNELTNVAVVETALSDKPETLRTLNDLRHCSFTETGANQANAVTLDGMMRDGVFDGRVAYVHLDVEGMEQRVLRGASDLLDAWSPIVAFEQHINSDPVTSLVDWLKTKGYIIFMITEVLPGCNLDCRNFLAFPTTQADALVTELTILVKLNMLATWPV